MNTYNPQEFLKAMKAGIPRTEQPVDLEGMVKTGESDATILFCGDGMCDEWIPIQLAAIESVTHLGKAPCEDHEHDYARIQLKVPANEEAALYFRLLKMLQDATPLPAGAVGTSDMLGEGIFFEDEDLEWPRLPSIPRPRWPSGSVARPSWPSGWRPPWTWSRCAKCKLGVQAFLTTTVAAAIYASGGNPPSMLAAAKALIAGAYGTAAANAAASLVLSGQFEQAAKIICKVHGKC